MENILEKLKKEVERENKCKARAILLLEQITEEIAHPLSELFGDEYDDDDDVPNGFIWVRRGVYFRYVAVNDAEETGFYLTNDGLPICGSPLRELKGELFWQCIIEVCEWVENVLPTLVQQHSEYRENSFSYLEKIAEAIDEAKNRCE